jgi:hypothetical protein
MRSEDARWTTLWDFGIEPSVVASDHSPRLHPGDQFVSCRTCGATVGFSATAEGPIRRALESLSAISCERPELPEEEAGDHQPVVTAEAPGGSREVRCESCGRCTLLYDDGDVDAVLRELAEIPCIDSLSYVELLDLLVSPSSFSPPLSDLGIENWRVRDGEFQTDVVRVFRHDRYQFTVHLSADDHGYVTAVRDSPNSERDPVGTLRFPSFDPSDPVARDAAVTLVRFLSATDSMTAGDLSSIRSAYEEIREDDRTTWLEDAYDRARERFEERFGDTPTAFSDAFDGVTDDEREIIRRLVSSGGFDAPDEPAFAREMLGHDHEFPGFIDFVAENHNWSPPVLDE